MDPFNYLVWGWIALAILIFLVLVIFNIKAPYGRHTTAGWGKMIDNHWGWFWMEIPAFVIMPMLSFLGSNEKSSLSLLLIGAWVLHYSYRTLIFPFKIKTKGKKIPIIIVISGLFFNGMNGFINGYYIGFLAPPDTDMINFHVIIGIFIFILGMIINRVSDQKLIALRNDNLEYKIPKGWLFETISCPNHLGEILEWLGFAIMAWNLSAVSFAIWTFCNLVPRALNHHQWYRQSFPDYPKTRKALIPFIW